MNCVRIFLLPVEQSEKQVDPEPGGMRAWASAGEGKRGHLTLPLGRPK